MNANLLKAIYYMFFATTFLGVVFGQLTAVSSAFCALVGEVRGIIALFALVMFLVGGVLYAIAHFLPSAGSFRGNLQGWAMGMILGGIIGVILVIIAQPIVNMVVGFGNGLSSVSC